MEASDLAPRDAALIDTVTNGGFFKVLARAYAAHHDLDVQVSDGGHGTFTIYLVVLAGDRVIESRELRVGPSGLQARHRLTLRRLANDDRQRQAARHRGASPGTAARS